MTVKVWPAHIAGTIKAPPSKSCTQRAFAAALITPGVSIIENAGSSNDEIAARNIIQALGAEVTQEGNAFVITSSADIFKSDDRTQNKVVNCGESGLSMRMFAPIAALFDTAITLTGSGSLKTRPMDFLDTYLTQLNVRVTTRDGKIPVTVRGPINPRNIKVDGSFSSQFLTGLLFAFCSAAKTPVSIEVENLTSKPYIDLSIAVLAKFGFKIINNNYESFDIIPATPKRTLNTLYRVEGDWSNAAFLAVAGALAGDLTVTGIDLDSSQGDKKILEVLYESGSDFLVQKDGILFKRNERLRAFSFDATQCPDLFPPLVALAANCSGRSAITGVSRLIHKESNRAIALRDEFGKMGVRIDLEDDVMTIEGSQLKGAEVSSHNDHRIAMATAVAALTAEGTTTICNADAVNKSYPGFYTDLQTLGARIEEN